MVGESVHGIDALIAAGGRTVLWNCSRNVRKRAWSRTPGTTTSNEGVETGVVPQDGLPLAKSVQGHGQLWPKPSLAKPFLTNLARIGVLMFWAMTLQIWTIPTLAKN